jgi:hypothetical protein
MHTLLMQTIWQARVLISLNPRTLSVPRTESGTYKMDEIEAGVGQESYPRRQSQLQYNLELHESLKTVQNHC